MTLKLPSNNHEQRCLHRVVWYMVYVLLAGVFRVQCECGISNGVVAVGEHSVEDRDYVEEEEQPYIYRKEPTDNCLMRRAALVEI